MTPKHLLVPTDGSALALKAMAEAVALAKPLAARITVLTAEAAVPMPLTGIGQGLDPALLDSLVAMALGCLRPSDPADNAEVDGQSLHM
jgi:nucleotide-binding universal stress UspA family protein